MGFSIPDLIYDECYSFADMMSRNVAARWLEFSILVALQERLLEPKLHYTSYSEDSTVMSHMYLVFENIYVLKKYSEASKF